MKITGERIEEMEIKLRAIGHDISAHDPQEIKDHIEGSRTMAQAIRDLDEYWR